MAWFVLFGMLAAFGFGCAGWLVLGSWLWAGGSGTVAVICDGTSRSVLLLRRLWWLRELGLFTGTPVAIDCGLGVRAAEVPKGIEIWSLTAAAAKLELEREKLGGIGDLTGRDQRCCISEL